MKNHKNMGKIKYKVQYIYIYIYIFLNNNFSGLIEKALKF